MAPAPLPPPSELLDISPDAIRSLESAKAKDKDKGKKAPAPPGTGRSRRPLVLGGAVVGLLGTVAALVFTGVIPPELLGLGAADPTPIAVVTPTPPPTATEATPAPTETAVAVVSATPDVTATVAATATVAVAQPSPTTTAVAAITKAPPAPTPTKAPEDPEVKKKKAIALVKSGNDALNAGDGPKSVKLFGAAIANDPANADAYLGLGTAYMIQNENAKAKKSLQKFLQLAPEHQYASQARQILGTL